RNKQVYIFVHINPAALTPNAKDCTELYDIFSKYPNIKAVFNGHDHDEEGIKMKNNIPYIFDAHFGGSWGTSYRGYRVVEVMKDGSAVTYVMNPKEIINKATIA
ncbi:MAG: metallophosphoesterase, partial [Flavitalea sp.]